MNVQPPLLPLTSCFTKRLVQTMQRDGGQLSWTSLDGVTVTGEVRDPADYIARATVCINPVQVGAGMQNKLIEFMAMRKAVVATSVANEGIRATPGEHLVIADDAPAFADAVLALLADPDRRTGLAAAARDYILESWTWEAHFLTLEADMLAALQDSVESENALSTPDGG